MAFWMALHAFRMLNAACSSNSATCFLFYTTLPGDSLCASPYDTLLLLQHTKAPCHTGSLLSLRRLNKHRLRFRQKR